MTAKAASRREQHQKHSNNYQSSSLICNINYTIIIAILLCSALVIEGSSEMLSYAARSPTFILSALWLLTMMCINHLATAVQLSMLPQDAQSPANILIASRMY